jgi:hypothetical protein
MNTVQNVRDQIKHSVQVSKEIVTRLRAAKGRERYDLWNEKRAHGADTRALLLALAYLRGKPYLRAELYTRTSVPAYEVARLVGVADVREVLPWFEAPLPLKAAA